MRIGGICGSLQAASSNRALLQAAASAVPAGTEFVLCEGLSRLPLFNPDLEAHSALAAVERWRDELRSCDALLIATPEYGHSLPGVLKNGIDWVIGSAELYRKPVAITSAVPHASRGRLGLAALATTLRGVDANIASEAALVRGECMAAGLAALLRELVDQAQAHTPR